MFRKNVSQTIGFGLVNISTGADDTSGNYGMNRTRDNDTMSSCTGNLVNKGNGQFVLVTSSDDLNGNTVCFFITGPSLATARFTIRTTQANPDDATRFGLSALPNAAAAAAGGLMILGSNAGAVTLASLAMGSGFVVGNSFSILNQMIAINGITANITGNLSGSIGSVSAGGIGATAFTTGALNAMADALLDRNMATGTDSGTNSVRTVRQSLRTSRNKVDTVNGIVFKEDDSTTSYTFSITTAAGNPITVFDPADV